MISEEIEPPLIKIVKNWGESLYIIILHIYEYSLQKKQVIYSIVYTLSCMNLLKSLTTQSHMWSFWLVTWGKKIYKISSHKMAKWR